MFLKLIDHKKYSILIYALILGGICTGLSILFSDNLAMDVANYYAPMAQEFADGNYSRAFYHMIPPLVPTLAGIVAKTGMEAFTALQIVAALFFLAGLWPLYRIQRRLLPPQLAQWSCLLYIVCPRLLRYVTMGSLEGAKIFLLLFTIERTLTYIEQKSYWLLCQIGLAMGAMSLTRGEGIGYLPLVGLLIFYGHLYNYKTSLFRSILRATGHFTLVVFLCLVLCSPWIIYEYNTIGYPCLDSRQAEYLINLLNRYDIGKHTQPEIQELLPTEAHVMPKIYNRTRNFRQNFKKTINGMFLPFFILIAFLLVYHYPEIKARWTWVDTLCVLVIVYNYFLFFEIAHVKKRYTAPAIPFLIHWVTLGGYYLIVMLKAKIRILRTECRFPLQKALLTVLIAICIWDGMSQLRSYLLYQQTDKEIGQWIYNHYEKYDQNKHPPLESALWKTEYHNGRGLVIAAALPQYAYFARADSVLIYKTHLYSYENLVKVCRSRCVDVLILEEKLQRSCPDFSLRNRHFRLISKEWHSQGILIYQFFPDSIFCQKM